MTNDPTLIDKALRTAVIATLAGVPMAYDGKTFDPPDTGVYAELTNVPGQVFAATLGEGGEDEHTGFYQVDLVQSKAEDPTPVTALWKKLYQAFPAGKALIADGQTVTVSGFQRSGRRTDGTRNRVAVTIYWRAFISRSPV